MGVFKLTHGYRYEGQGMLNVYFFLDVLGGSGNASELCGAFVDVVLPKIRNIQQDDTEHLFVSAEQLYGLVGDQYTINFVNTFGLRTGDGFPSHDSMSFQLLVSTNSTRMGRKAIGGVPESDFAKGTPFGNTIGRLNECADVLHATLYDGILDTRYIPVVYRIVDLGFDVANDITSARFARVSTQNSRKGYTNSSISPTSVVADLTLEADGGGNLPLQGNFVAEVLKPDQLLALHGLGGLIEKETGNVTPLVS